ncbi:MAG: VanZ family protein [Coriobacteriia bacterium]|nr:VanZ family protein [Coriobacteriia bacterium]
MWPRLARWVPSLAWMSVIFWFSSRPGSDVPGKIAPLAHFAEYAILGALLMFAASDPARWLDMALVASTYGITDEIHQAFVPGRTPDVGDWVLDTVGALAGALIVARVLQRRQRADTR